METTSEEEAYLWEDDYLDVVADGEEYDGQSDGTSFLADVASRGASWESAVACADCGGSLLTPSAASEAALRDAGAFRSRGDGSAGAS